MSVYERILVAVDLQHSPEVVLQKALNLADSSSVIELVNVVVPVNDALYSSGMSFVAPIIDVEQTEKEIIKNARNALDELSVSHGQEIKHEVLIGQIYQQLLQKIEEFKPDVVVLGSHAKSGLELLFGSVATHALHHASCDLLAVKV